MHPLQQLLVIIDAFLTTPADATPFIPANELIVLRRCLPV
jgi:hypothetical protein